jgi:hypothetical protein
MSWSRPTTVAAGVLIAGGSIALAAPASANQDCGKIPASPEFGVANYSSLSCADAIGILTNYSNLPQIKSGDTRSAVMGAWTCSNRGAQETSEDNIAFLCQGPSGKVEAYVNGQ